MSPVGGDEGGPITFVAPSTPLRELIRVAGGKAPAPVLFLDVDGVLNDHAYDPLAESTTLLPACVARLNRVLLETGCDLVLSSAWRYMVLGRAMTLQGFEYLLRTHGVRCPGRVVGHTGRDLNVGDPQERGRQVRAWLEAHGPVERWAVVDDLALGFEDMPFVQTDGARGLQDGDAERLIALLKEGP